MPVMVIGTPGGSRIITVVVHCILNVVDYGMNIQEAIDAPRFHQQWLPETTNVELFALSPDTRKILVDMGHKLGDPQPAVDEHLEERDIPAAVTARRLTPHDLHERKELLERQREPLASVYLLAVDA